MKRLSISIFSLLLSLSCFTQTQWQKDNALWHFGDRAGIRFLFPTNGDPVYTEPVNDSRVPSGFKGTAVLNKFEDGIAEAVLTTNGRDIFRPNGSRIGEVQGSDVGFEILLRTPDSSGSAVVIPFPNMENFAYIFGGDKTYIQKSYTLVMGIELDTVNGNHNDYLASQGYPIGHFSTEQIASAKGTCGDMWYLGHHDSNVGIPFGTESSYYACKITFDSMAIQLYGIGFPERIFPIELIRSYVGTTFPNLDYGNGVMQLTHDHEYAVITALPGLIEMTDFNRTTGKFSDAIVIDTSANNPYGACFSPDNSLLYVAESIELGPNEFETSIFQYDVSIKEKSFIRGSKLKVATFLSSTNEVNLQITPHYQIFIGREDKNYLSAITKPNLRGTSCEFVNEAANLGANIYKGPALHSVVNRPDDIVPDYYNNVLPADTVLCTGQSLELTPKPGNLVCLWQDSSMVQSKTITEEGLYWVRVNQNDLCLIQDSINISFIDNPVPELPLDTVLCSGDTIAIGVDIDNASINWSTGETLDSIKIGEAGLYWVEATIGDCVVRDSINIDVIVNTESLLAQDTSFCEGSEIVIEPLFELNSVTWSNGSNDSSLDINQEGQYFIDAIIGDCKVSDTINVTMQPNPEVDLGKDSLLCLGQSLTLLASDNGKYLWQDGSVLDSLTVNEVGTYWLEILKNNCKSRDSIFIAFYNHELPNIGNDTIICSDESINLEAKGGFENYIWNTSDIEQIISVKESGLYSVSVTIDNCIYSDSIMVEVKTSEKFDIGADTTLCLDEPFQIDMSLFEGEFLWSDGTNSAINNIKDEGLYWLEINANGCSFRDSIYISSKEDNCNCELFIPNVINVNDIENAAFRPYSNCQIEDYKLSIFNRWGNLIFESKDFNEFWEPEDNITSGVFVYKINHLNNRGIFEEKFGTITIFK